MPSYLLLAAVAVAALGGVAWYFTDELASQPASQLLIHQARIAIATASCSVFAVAVLVSYLVARRRRAAVASLEDALVRIAGAEYHHRLRVSRGEELGFAAEALNALAEQTAEHVGRITQRNREQEAVLESMVEGVIAVDTEQRLISMNHAASKLLSTTLENVEGRSLQEVVRNTDLRRFVTSTLAADRPLEGDVILRGTRERILKVGGVSLRNADGRSIGAVVVLNDVSRLRQLENMRRDFAASVSHELKTPITSIQGFVETLLDGALHQPEQAERFLRIVARQAERLSAIIDDLLALARIEKEAEAGDLEVELVPLCPVVDAAVKESEALAAELGVSIERECDPEARAWINPPLLSQALQNLLDNAIKYSEKGRAVRVVVSRDDTEVRLAVHDRGLGIAPEHHARLFERFYRVDKARSRKQGGTGLGLAIVKHVVNAHRGSITVDSAPGRGSVFTVHLPHRPG